MDDVSNLIERICSKGSDDDPSSSSLSPDSEAAISIFEELLDFHRMDSIIDAHYELREYIIQYGIPNGISQSSHESFRSIAWKLLLGVPYYFDVDHYLHKVEVKIFPYHSRKYYIIIMYNLGSRFSF
jgi:hypothetical protein